MHDCFCCLQTKGVFAAITASFWSFVYSGQYHLLGVALGVFRLYSVEQISIHNSIVVVLQIVLDDLSVILHSLMAEKVCTVGLLCENVTFIFFVAKDALKDYRMPFCVLFL